MDRPTVCVLTPVYNGAEYLAECIESVLAQTYGDFEYHIVDNCSSDDTPAIAAAYAARDPRIRVHSPGTFVPAIANHNRAFGLVAPHCKYCKVVSADDWIMRECLSRMVMFAEAHPGVGVVGSYQVCGDTLKWRGLPPGVNVLSGRDAARVGLLHGIHVLGTPTSVLYRADLVRRQPHFFPHPRSYADASACYETFQHADFGFIHEALAVERVHSGQWSAAMHRLSAACVGYIDILLKYGPLYLTPQEFEDRRTAVFASYYRGLGGYLLKLRERTFWEFHRDRLHELGCPLEWSRVVKGALQEACEEARHPWSAAGKVCAVLREKFSIHASEPHPS